MMYQLSDPFTRTELRIAAFWLKMAETKSGGLLVSLERKSHFPPAGGVSGSHGTSNHEELERKQL